MSLPHALLTSLIERPASGLELSKRFDRSIGYFWHATHQQIYRELGRMEKAGWIESSQSENTRGRKRVYQVLSEGREELQRWVSESHTFKPGRYDLMVKLRAEAVIGPTKLYEDVQRQLILHQNNLKNYEEIDKRDFSKTEMTRQERIQHLVLASGINYEKQWIETCRMILKELMEDEINRS